MNPAHIRAPLGATTIAIAAIGCLQPGIDPIFLTILSAEHDLDPLRHGWIVGASQGGMALGAIAVWRYRHAFPQGALAAAALVAALCGVATAFMASFTALLLIRGMFGLATGLLYTLAMSQAAARRPTTAYAAVFLTQLLLSTGVAFLLPAISGSWGPRAALLTLVAGPLAVTLLALLSRASTGPSSAPLAGMARTPTAAGSDAAAPPPAGWALAGATFAFITATMMVWSFTGALAMRYEFGEDMIGLAVALGSIIGAFTALVVMREKRAIPLPLTGLLASICLLAPLVLTPLGDDRLFVSAILLLNIGSTAIIIRCSGAAAASSENPRFRRFVACTHPLGMIAGPVLGSVLTAVAGSPGLELGAMSALAAGCALLLLAARRRHSIAGGAVQQELTA